MRLKWSKWVAVVLFCLYAAAVLHQVLPGHLGHANGNSCLLCQLLTSLVLLAVVLALVSNAEARPALFSLSPPYCREIRYSFLLRGPPKFLLN